jgi:hypothetical protein
MFRHEGDVVSGAVVECDGLKRNGRADQAALKAQAVQVCRKQAIGHRVEQHQRCAIRQALDSQRIQRAQVHRRSSEQVGSGGGRHGRRV